MRLLFTLLLISLTFSVRAQFDAQAQIKRKLTQDRYMAFLNNKGYSPEVDSDGDIKFTYKNRSYYITIDDKEDRFFRLARLANLKLESTTEITRAKEICHDITQDVKVAKVYWLKNIIWMSSELLMPDKESYELIFDRCLELTESAYLKFVKEWKDR